MSHPIYVCPYDETALAVGAASLRCPTCGKAFPVEDGIALLDVVQNEDRAAFDPSARSSVRLTAGQLSAAAGKVQALFDAARISGFDEAVILDLGCGFGDLSCGLVAGSQVRNSQVYAVDHSIESMRVLSRSAAPANGNTLHLSIQDAAALCFPAASFNLVVASAVLHHVLDYRSLLSRVAAILRPGGMAVFVEPFCYGYLFPVLFLRMAVAELRIDSRRLQEPEFGMCQFLMENIAARIRHEDDLEYLKGLTDKHLFREDRLAAASYSVGFTKVQFQNYAQPLFYDDWLHHLLSVYQIQNRELADKADGYYQIFRSMFGLAVPNLTSHFKYIILTR